MLKADFHIHTKEGLKDDWIRYSAKELIDRAVGFDFDVLAITNHCSVYYPKELVKYAKEKGILLISGIEAEIENKEIVILNVDKTIENVKTFAELKKYKEKNPDIFVLAPHPYYPKKKCLLKDLNKHISIFDGIEHSFLHCFGFNYFNKKAVKTAKKYGKSVIGTSDSHYRFQLNKTFSLVDADKNIKSVISALKQKKVVLKTKPISYINCFRFVFNIH